MRVAVEFPDGSIAAYKLGRIEDGVHNLDLLSGEITPIDEFVDKLLARAKKEHPDCKVYLQRMVIDDQEEDTSTWIHHKEFDPEQHTPTPPGGQVRGVELSATAGVSGEMGGRR